MNKNLKEKIINLFCKEYSGNKGKLTVCDALFGITITVIFTFCLMYICSVIGYLLWELKYMCLDDSPGTMFYLHTLISLFNINNFITGTLVVTLCGVVGFLLMKVLKIKIMDCPVCEKEEKKVSEEF